MAGYRIKVKSAAKSLGVTPRTVRNLVKRKKLRPIPISEHRYDIDIVSLRLYQRTCARKALEQRNSDLRALKRDYVFTSLRTFNGPLKRPQGVTIKEAAARLMKCVRTVNRLVHRHELHRVWVTDKRSMISFESLQKYMTKTQEEIEQKNLAEEQFYATR